MKPILAALVLAPLPAFAADWTRLDGAAIGALLTDRKAEYIGDYKGFWQSFAADGATVYFSGEPSQGRWAVRGDRYCSVWPPSDRWDCYDMAGDGAGGLRFIGADGSIFEGRIAE